MGARRGQSQTAFGNLKTRFVAKTSPMAREIDNGRKVGGDFVEPMNAP
jgi:hypothetical protein